MMHAAILTSSQGPPPSRHWPRRPAASSFRRCNEAGYIGAYARGASRLELPAVGGRDHRRGERLQRRHRRGRPPATRRRPPPAAGDLRVLELAEGGKMNALNVGDAPRPAASASTSTPTSASLRVSSPSSLAVLDRPEPAYASGRPSMAPADSWVTRAYTRSLAARPVHDSRRAGRRRLRRQRRWPRALGHLPGIIADDTFVRLQFAPAERIGVPSRYELPDAGGLPAPRPPSAASGLWSLAR